MFSQTSARNCRAEESIRYQSTDEKPEQLQDERGSQYQFNPPVEYTWRLYIAQYDWSGTPGVVVILNDNALMQSSSGAAGPVFEPHQSHDWFPRGNTHKSRSNSAVNAMTPAPAADRPSESIACTPASVDDSRGGAMKLRTLTVRSLPEDTYNELKRAAAARGRSMEAEARLILVEAATRLSRWKAGAVLADLSGPETLADLETPFVRSDDHPSARP
ncbi:MAG: hypothetical protein LBC97_02040 [Bifidobacteriaceae bacterium]|nr:hypothetical protein [Bifidobacteriaceae bacterium]